MWFIVGILLGLAVLGLIWFLRLKNVSPTWYEWLIGLVAVLLLLFSIQNLSGAMSEKETTAGLIYLAFFGLPAVILLALDWQLIARRQRAG